MKISTDKTSVKKGGTLALIPINPKDESGNTIDEVLATDIEWSCDASGVSIGNDGVLAVSDTFEIGENAEKDITVTGTINNISESRTITVYSYAYYDSISDISQYNGVMGVIGERNTALFPNARTTSVYTLSDKVNLNKNTTISYKQAWGGSNLDGKDRIISFKNSGGETLFSIKYVYNVLSCDSVEVGQLKPANEWQEIQISIDISSGAMTVVCGDTSTTHNIDTSKLTDIVAVELTSAAGVVGYESRPLGICDIKATQ